MSLICWIPLDRTRAERCLGQTCRSVQVLRDIESKESSLLGQDIHVQRRRLRGRPWPLCLLCKFYQLVVKYCPTRDSFKHIENLYYTVQGLNKQWYTVADLRGREGARGPNSFDFMQFLEKFGKIVCWRPPPRGVGAPSSGKSWIRRWYDVGI